MNTQTEKPKLSLPDREFLAALEDALWAMEDAAYWKREARAAQGSNKELLAALKECDRIYGADWNTGTYASRTLGATVRAAIAKAEGHSP